MEEEAHLVGHLLIPTGVVLAVLHEDRLIVPVLGREKRKNEERWREEKGGKRTGERSAVGGGS